MSCVQIDGGLKTGLDVAKAAALGADEYRVRHRVARLGGMRHGATVPREHVPGRHRDAAQGAAREVPGDARSGRELSLARRRQSARFSRTSDVRTLGELVGASISSMRAPRARDKASTPRGSCSRARRAIESGQVAAEPAIRPQPPTDLNARLLDAGMPRLGRCRFMARADHERRSRRRRRTGGRHRVALRRSRQPAVNLAAIRRHGADRASGRSSCRA
jgi:hypothetical protein